MGRPSPLICSPLRCGQRKPATTLPRIAWLACSSAAYGCTPNEDATPRSIEREEKERINKSKWEITITLIYQEEEEEEEEKEEQKEKRMTFGT